MPPWLRCPHDTRHEASRRCPRPGRHQGRETVGGFRTPGAPSGVSDNASSAALHVCRRLYILDCHAHLLLVHAAVTTPSNSTRAQLPHGKSVRQIMSQNDNLPLRDPAGSDEAAGVNSGSSRPRQLSFTMPPILWPGSMNS
jgi:hypothetical protein